MDDSASLSHSKWECKYHVVFIPKCRKKTLYEQLRPHLGEVTEAQKTELDSRLADYLANPDDVVSWSEVKAAALAKIRQ